MLRQLPIAILFASVSLLAQNTVTFTYSGAPLQIYTDAANIASVAEITVGRVFTIQKATINVTVNYAPVGDINLYAFAPDGTRTKLLERNCGNQGTLVNMTFDDASQSKYADFCPAEPGRGPFGPNEPLANFAGKGSSGTWRLAVENNGSQNTGWLTGFSITFTTVDNITAPTITNVVNRSSLKGGAVAPGRTSWSTGANIGPTAITNAPAAQPLPTTLGGKEIKSPTRSTPRQSLRLPDRCRGHALRSRRTADPATAANGSNMFSSYVQATAPGMYSQGVIGGPTGGWAIVKAVDQNFKVITPDNPAVKGSNISVYASGLGATNPVLPAGQIPTSLYVTTTPTNASIGGIPATVLFSGLAPGFPGVYQLNIRVPDNVGSGNQLIIIWNGGGVSQDSLSLPVK